MKSYRAVTDQVCYRSVSPGVYVPAGAGVGAGGAGPGAGLYPGNISATYDCTAQLITQHVSLDRSTVTHTRTHKADFCDYVHLYDTISKIIIKHPQPI